MPQRWYAHSRPGRPRSDWEPLALHRRRVRWLAGRFAAAMGLRRWGEAAGWLHDLGKACEAFLRRLDGAAERVDHSTAGAVVAERAYGQMGLMLAYAVAGHHAGLADAGDLVPRLKAGAPEFDAGATGALPQLERDFAARLKGVPLGLSMLVRMVFSCLVDADFLATERFYRPERKAARRCAFDPDALLAGLETKLAEVAAKPSTVNPLRAEVLRRCREAGARQRGLFSLTVPTGGGKTLSSLAFALEHAKASGLGRVVYVIPYTSIVEQTAQVFREALGKDAVLEHHSNFRPGGLGLDEDDLEKLRLAEENWAAPVVVTTSVQFFESLFAGRPAACRKLHNLANAVVVLDEAQLLPVEFLRPCIEALRALVKGFGASVVLCTATQPALGRSAWLPDGLDLAPEAEIMGGAVERLHEDFRRVRLVDAGEADDATLAAWLAERPQAMAVVNRREDARALFGEIAGLDGAAHLSARMCPAHRSQVLKRLRADLDEGRPCRLVATSLVEAGVDIDFPVVFRAMAGLASLIQAAGRCNRNGRADLAEVRVFCPAAGLPRSLGRQATLAARVLAEFDDPMSPQAVEWYFRHLYDGQAAHLDSKGILPLLVANPQLAFGFATAARDFRLIEDAMVDVAVPWDDEAEAAIAAFRADPERPWAHLRRLQPFTVQVYRRDYEALLREGAVSEPVHGRVPVLDRDRYDELLGLQPGR